MKDQYLISIRLIERLHRRFLDVIKAELDRLGIEDINNVQTLILFNINEEQLTVGELTVRGYYLGSNVSYNVKKLVENDYLIQERSSHDRRMTRVRLSQKGLDLTARISDLYQRNSDELAGRFVGEEQLRQLARTLQEVAATIPPDIGWILRVDGHTDRLPIRDAPFRNNWELSVERALAVVEFLTRQGIPPDRLAATGFGEYQPLDPADDEIAYRRNRRIEFKLTER